MQPDEVKYIEQLETELQDQQNKNIEMQRLISQSTFQSQQQGNPIQYQLETAEMLSRLEHFYRGDILKVDDEGNEYYEEQKDKRLVTLNNLGVNEIMSLLGKYLDKNTILSNYREERIYEILADLGDELTEFIECNYEKIGMDSKYKETKFKLIILTTLHTIESAYRRAIGGKALEELNASRIYTQLDRQGGLISTGTPTKRKFNLFNPKTW